MQLPEFQGQMTSLSLEDYKHIWQEQRATSLPDLPRDPVFERFSSKADSFAIGSVYPVWWIDPGGTGFVSHHDPNRQPVAFSELLNHDHLCREMLERRQINGQRQRVHPLIICEYCSTYDVTVVKDGCKELLAILYHEKSQQLLTVVQVRGADWSCSWRDMGFILHWRRKH